jgi:hypothetical protein
MVAQAPQAYSTECSLVSSTHGASKTIPISETVPSTSAEYEKVIVVETEKWGKVIRAANIKAE